MNTCLPNILWQKNQLRSFLCVFFHTGLCFISNVLSSKINTFNKEVVACRHGVVMATNQTTLHIKNNPRCFFFLFKRVIFVNLKEKKLKGCSSFDRTYSVLQQQKYHLNWNQAVQKALKVHCYLIFYFKDSRETR